MNLIILLLAFLIAFAESVPVEPQQEALSRRSKGDVGCKNERGESVDWFIVYKLPELPSSSKSMEKEGLAHVYMDESTQGQWRQSSVSFDSENHAVGHTLAQLYNRGKDDFYVMYNDEMPSGKTSSTKGHAKGVAMFDQSSGFWLLHSVPKFPPAKSYSFPTGGQKFGQMLLCVSFPYESLKDIGDQLNLYEPNIYASSLPDEIAKQYEVLATVIEEKSKSAGPLKRELKMHSSGGMSFTSFAKHGKWDGELYADLVAPSLKQSLYVETWQNGRGDIPSSCKGSYHVNNINEVQVTKNVEFTNSKDHSKWAVSSGKSSGWICVGGINRQNGQITRGGGTMCMKNNDVWDSFSAMVKETQPC